MRDWLRDLRKAHGMSEKQVAMAIGMSQPPYHRIEKGQSRPRVENAMKIGRLLQFDWRRFYEEGGE